MIAFIPVGRRSRLKSLAAAIVLAFGLGPAASAMTVGLFTVFSPVRFEDILPEDCLIFGSVELPNWSDGEKLSLKKLFDEPEVRVFADSVVDRAKGVQSLVNMIFHEDAQAALAQVSRIGFSLGGVRSVSSSGRKEPSFALALEIANDKAGFLAALANLRAMVERESSAGRAVSVTERRHTYSGQEITEISVGNQGSLQVAYTLIDSLFVAAADPISVQSLVDNYRNPPKQPLSRLDTFLKSRERAEGQDAALLVFFNLRAFRDSYLGQLSEHESASWKALGLEDVDGVCYTLRLSGAECVERVFVHAPPPPHSSWPGGIVTPKSADFRSLDLVSRDSSFYQAWKADWPRTMEEIESMFGELEPESLPAIKSLEAEFERATGIRFREDFLASLGEEVSISAVIQPGSFVPNALITIEVLDPAKFESAVTSALSAAGMEFAPCRQADPASDRIRLLVPKASAASPVGPFGRMVSFAGFMPALLHDGNTFLFASHPNLLKPVVAGHGSGVENPMRVHPDISRALAEPGPAPSTIELIDLKRIFTLLYGIATPLILSAPRDFLPFDSALLPTAESIARHLSAATMTSRTDKDGWLWRCTSPLPFGLVGIALVAGAAVLVSGVEIPDGADGAVPSTPVSAEPPRPAGANSTVEPSVALLEMNAKRYELAGNRAKAIETMDRAIEAAPTSGGLRYTRGCMRLSDARDSGSKEKFASSREDFLEAVRLDVSRGDSHYNVACAFALEGRKDEAFAALRKALEAGFTKFRLLREDTDLANLRSDSRFAEIVREIESGALRPERR